MTLGTMLLMIAGVAVLLTLLSGFVLKAHKSWLMSFLQHFCGALFVWSGYVKAVDPIGTAIKMEQYFAEFERTASGSFLSFLAPMFPFFSEHALAFSIFVIIFEILLGVMLILGSRPKFTVWAFFGLVIFFTILTGYTFLTGYVPADANFFEFGKWTLYNASNMKVTDCGCFGDFIKLEPRTSFMKDVFLLLPAFYFIFRRREMHQLFTRNIRNVIFGLSAVLLALFCYRNTSLDEPIQDFRAFKAGVNIREIKKIESEAENAVKVIAYRLTDKKTGKAIEVPYEQFIKEMDKYPDSQYTYEQVKTEPTVKRSKISDFAIYDPEGVDFTEDLLNAKKYMFLIIAPKLYGQQSSEKASIKDTIWTVDTVRLAGSDSFSLVKNISSINTVTEDRPLRVWDSHYINIYDEVINPFVEAAAKASINTIAVVGGASKEEIEDFRHAAQTAYPFFTADDVLLKTIMRSNPGVVLMKEGQIIQKWHYKKLPSFEEVKAAYIR